MMISIYHPTWPMMLTMFYTDLKSIANQYATSGPHISSLQRSPSDRMKLLTRSTIEY